MKCFLQEFERLEDASGVFKLIGPVLILQDPIEVGARHAKWRGVLVCRWKPGAKLIRLSTARRRTRCHAHELATERPGLRLC